MLSRLLITTTCAILALMGNQQALAAPADDVAACTRQAFALYDLFTRRGCDHEKPVEECEKLFTNNINGLNTLLDRCERTDYVTLCRIVPGGFWPWDANCSSLVGAGKLTKDACEAALKDDYEFVSDKGERTLFKAANSRCINAIDYDCHKLCG